MTASVLPELWCALRPRPPRPPIDWRSVRVSVALAVAGTALIISGLTEHAFGATGLGWGMIGFGVVMFVAAGQERW